MAQDVKNGPHVDLNKMLLDFPKHREWSDVFLVLYTSGVLIFQEQDILLLDLFLLISNGLIIWVIYFSIELTCKRKFVCYYHICETNLNSQPHRIYYH